MNSNEVFISYSRKDQEFVRILDAAFRQIDRDPWVDWNDIQKGEEWWKAIERGIEGADTFVFVLSPDSVNSSVCRDEIDHAAKHNKRFLPIVRREGFEMERVHPRISSHNWLFFRETDDFERAFGELLQAISLDLDYVRTHTRLLVRAIEWQDKGNNPSYLLRGADLAEANQWLQRGTLKDPKPTGLHSQYIKASLEAQATRLKARQRAKRTVVLTTIVANLLLAAGGGIWFYNLRLQEAVDHIQDEMEKALGMGVLGTNGDEFAVLAKFRETQGKLPANNRLYQAHQNWLRSLRQVFPDLFVYTYVKGTPGQLLWIGDVSRELPDHVLAGVKRRTQFLGSFEAKHSELEVYQGKRITIMKPYEDSLGRWISAAAPIKDSKGKIVGGMVVEYTADYLEQQMARARNALLLAYGLIFGWQAILSLVILRALRSAGED